MRYFQHHIGDYTVATAHLSFIEDAAYHRCLRRYYQDEKPLPPDLAAVARLVGARTKEERQAVSNVLSEFFEICDDGYHQKRADKEIAAYQKKAKTARDNGTNGGRPSKPKENQSGSDVGSYAEPDGGQREKLTINHEPLTKNSEAKASAPDVASIVFNQAREWLIANTGRSDQECRKLLGKWRKSASDGDIIGAVGAAQRAGAVEPIGYIEGVLRQKAPAKLVLQV